MLKTPGTLIYESAAHDVLGGEEGAEKEGGTEVLEKTPGGEKVVISAEAFSL